MVENDYYIDIYHVRVFKWSDIQKTACRTPKWNETQYSKQTKKKNERDDEKMKHTQNSGIFYPRTSIHGIHLYMYREKKRSNYILPYARNCKTR